MSIQDKVSQASLIAWKTAIQAEQYVGGQVVSFEGDWEYVGDITRIAIENNTHLVIESSWTVKRDDGPWIKHRNYPISQHLAMFPIPKMYGDGTFGFDQFLLGTVRVYPKGKERYSSEKLLREAGN